jgi:hypothetical protein
MGFTVRDLTMLARAALRRERLPEEPVPTPRPGSGPALLGYLFAREPLPLEPEAPPRKGAVFLRVVLAREALPEEPPRSRPGRERRPWLAWLLFPEKLGPPPPPGAGPP